MPREDSFNLQGLPGKVDLSELFYTPREFWINECDELTRYFDEQVNDDLPEEISRQLYELKDRFVKLDSKLKLKQRAI